MSPLIRCASYLTGSASVLIALMGYAQPSLAQVTRLPSNPNINFQTSGRSAPPGTGDWYTTATSASPIRQHEFFISVTADDLARAGGSVTVRILDAENNGNLDQLDQQPTNVETCATRPCDPARFRLLNSARSVIAQQVIPSNSPDGTVITFPAITVPGNYIVTSESGSFPINGDATVATNDDDNGFVIEVQGVLDLLIGQFQGTFQNVPGVPAQDYNFFFLVGPGTTNLFLRNFDMDSDAAGVDYIRPNGTVAAGTVSGGAVWNNGGDLNNGGDSVALTGSTANQFADSGRWGLTLRQYGAFTNQSLLEANTGTTGDPNNRLPILDAPPTRAGNFLITTDTTLETPVGQRVCHPFRVTNNFFTTDIINLTATGTNPNYTVQFFRDAAGTIPLTDTDGNGQLDTGILQPGQFIDLFFCVTPGPGALLPDGTVIVDRTTITGTSFMDQRVRAQAGTGAPVPQSVVKTTSPPRGGGGTNVVGTPNFRLVKRITNVTRNGAVLPGVNFGTFIDDPGTSDDNAPGWPQSALVGILALPTTNPVRSGDEVTYTVYFLSDGTAPVLDTSICDQIPGGTTFVLNSLELGLANNPATSTGEFFTPLAPLPDNNSCPVQTNPNGATVTNLGTVSNTAGSNFGFIRFRVRVN